MLELPGHPFFIATLFVPQVLSQKYIVQFDNGDQAEFYDIQLTAAPEETKREG